MCSPKTVFQVDILVHSLANGPEVTKPLLETSRKVHLQMFLFFVSSAKPKHIVHT